MALACLAICSGLSPGQPGFAQDSGTPPGRPNIVLIMADDLDVGSMSYLPRTKALLADRGLTFKNAFVTDSICCPSRASFLRGQYPHNHGVLTVDDSPTGAFRAFYEQGRESSTIATWLKDAGYRTVLLGKYFNGYKDNTHIPPGWDEWYATDGAGTQFNENGTLKTYDTSVYNPTDVLADHATDYIRRTVQNPRPFLMYLTPKPPHARSIVADRHKYTFADAQTPRTPSFNEKDVTDKPSWVRSKPLLSPENEAFIDARYRERLQTLLALDELVERVVTELETSGELNNTYIFFTSDNGYHMGQHRLMPMKQTAYEEDIRVPMIVRGPGVPAGATVNRFVLNNDFAPTFAGLAGAVTPDFVDGRSFKPLLDGVPPTTWRRTFLVEKWGELAMRHEYKAVRTPNYTYVEYGNGERELYDLTAGCDDAAPGIVEA